MGKMVEKPSIACKLRRIPCNYIYFATFGGKRGLSSMQLAYVCGMFSMQLVCVCVMFSMQLACVCGLYFSRARTCSKKWFFRKDPQQ
jgi:hypothetical protein